MPHHLSIVLIEPKIPSNTGSIGRLCLATGSILHLVEPLGFEINDTQLRRAGLDYWKHLRVIRHKNVDVFFGALPEKAPLVFFSAKAQTSVFDHRFQNESYLIFGSETEGVGQDMLKKFREQTYRIPQYDNRVRSLNLANAASIVLYEAIRQLGP